MPETLPKKEPPSRRLARRASAVLLAGLIGLGGWIGYGQLHADALLREAKQAAQRREHLQALAQFDLYLAERPNDAEASFLAARAARRGNDLRRARELLDRAEQLGWVANAIAVERSLLRVQRGGLAAEEAFLHDLLQRDHPDSVLILETLCLAYFQVFNVPVAEGLLVKWTEAEKDNPTPLVLLGDLHMWMGHKAEALEAFAEAARRGPNEPEALSKYGELLLEFHRSPEALQQFEAASRCAGAGREVWLGLARCKIEMGELDAARQILERLDQTHDDPEILHERGRLEFMAHDYARSEDYLRKAIEM